MLSLLQTVFLLEKNICFLLYRFIITYVERTKSNTQHTMENKTML